MVLALAVAGVVAMDPEHRHVPLCPFHFATGWQCPFCGSLRAVWNLAHGRLLPALHDNLIFVLAVPVMALLWGQGYLRRRASRPVRRSGRAAQLAVVALLVVFTVVRNLPGFGVLRPA